MNNEMNLVSMLGAMRGRRAGKKGGENVAGGGVALRIEGREGSEGEEGQE